MVLGCVGGLLGPAQCSMCIRDLIENLRQTALVGGANLTPPILQRLERFSYGLASFIAQRRQFPNVEGHGRSAFLFPTRGYRAPFDGHIGRNPRSRQRNRLVLRVKERTSAPGSGFALSTLKPRPPLGARLTRDGGTG